MSKSFLVTINNPTDVLDPDAIDGASYAVWQLERGESGELGMCHLESLFR